MKELRIRYIINRLSKYFEVQEPSLWLVYDLPSDGVPKGYSLNKKGHGWYNPILREVVIELFKPTDGKKYPDRAILHCLAHEFAHHLEHIKFGMFTYHCGKFAALVRKVKRLIKEVNND